MEVTTRMAYDIVYHDLHIDTTCFGRRMRENRGEGVL